MKKAQYHDMLKDEIREFVSMYSCNTLDGKIARACKREIDSETMRKRTQVSDRSGKKPKFVDF